MNTAGPQAGDAAPPRRPVGPDALPTVVIATHDRRERLLATLDHFAGLAERPPLVVVDTGSTDGTPEAVRRRHPWVEVTRAPARIGSAARTVGTEAAHTSLVAFCDDDSWWAPGALRLAAELFSAHPRLGLLAARIVVEPDGRLDPTCALMRESPLPAADASPGSPVLGFLACGAVARRAALLECGGFHRHYGFGGEEHLVAVDLVSAGWDVAYVDSVVAHHAPTPGPRTGRAVRELRNDLWSTWLRRPLGRAVFLTAHLVIAARGTGCTAFLAALRGLPWVIRERDVVPRHVERSLRLLDDR